MDKPTHHIKIINDLSYICRLVMVNKMAMLLSVSYHIGMCTLRRGCTKPGHQVSRATKFCTVATNICWSSVRNLLHVILQTPKIWNCLVVFYFANLYNLARIGMNHCPQKQTREHILFRNLWQILPPLLFWYTPFDKGYAVRNCPTTNVFLISPFIVPPVLLQTISTLMSLLMACRRCIQWFFSC